MLKEISDRESQDAYFNHFPEQNSLMRTANIQDILWEWEKIPSFHPLVFCDWLSVYFLGFFFNQFNFLMKHIHKEEKNQWEE